MKTPRLLKLTLTIVMLFPALSLFAQTDLTNLIVNPSFETGDYTGWTWTGWTGGWQDVNNDGGTTKDGNYIAGHWNNDIADVECSQTVVGLEPGYYMVTAYATVSIDRSTNQRLFANNKSTLYGMATNTAYTESNLAILGGTETYKFGGYPEVTTENGPFKTLSVVNQVTNGTLTFGFRFSGKGSALGYDFSYSPKQDAGFFKFDNFKLMEVSHVATVTSINLNVGKLSSAFSPDTLTYNAILPIGTTSVTPTVIPFVDGTSVVGAGIVDVSSGKGISTIQVTAMDGTTKQSYVINYKVLEASDDATLSSLFVSDGTLEPAFSPADTAYTVYVPIGTTAVTAIASVNDVLSTLKGDGKVTLNNGTGKSIISVTAESGDVKNYTIQYDWAYLANPSFEEENLTGWNWKGSDGYVWAGVNTDGDETKTGSKIAGCWNQYFGDVELSQTITGLANGNYNITADLMGSSNVTTSRLTTQRLFANNQSMLFGADTCYSAENLAILGASETYTFGGYTELLSDGGPFRKLTVIAPVTDGTLTIGIRTNGDSSALGYKFPKLTKGDGHGWFKVDNFRMRYDSPLSSIRKNQNQPAEFHLVDRMLYVENATEYSVYNVQGMKIANVKTNNTGNGILLKPGLYIVKTTNCVFKVPIK